MPSAKPAYDTDGSWKRRKFSPQEWEDLKIRLREKLKPFYPDKKAIEDPTFGHPADEWTNYLLSEAWGAVSALLWRKRRLTNEQLRAEQADLLGTLKNAADKLSTVSHDLDILFGVDADVLGARDMIRKLIPFVEGSFARIAVLPKASRIKEAQHAAALEMAIRCLRVLKDAGGKVSATAQKDLDDISDAIKMLKIIGDALRLYLDETTWKKVVIEAKKAAINLK